MPFFGLLGNILSSVGLPLMKEVGSAAWEGLKGIGKELFN